MNFYICTCVFCNELMNYIFTQQSAGTSTHKRHNDQGIGEICDL